MTQKELKIKAAKLKDQMSTRRFAQATYKEIMQLIVCKQKGDFTPMYETRLYTKLSSEYCEYLQLLHQ